MSVASPTRPSPSPTSQTRRRRKEARPDELLDAALELFATKGFAATRSEEVARHAGVSKGTLYLYYPSKEELLSAVIRQRLSAQIAEMSQRVAQHPGSASEVLLEWFPAWWTQVIESPTSAVFKIIITEVRNFPEIAAFYLREVVEPAHRMVGSVLERGIRSGEFRPVDVQGATLSLVMPMVMLCVHRHSVGACVNETLSDPHRFIHDHVQLIVAGLRPLAPPAAARRRVRTGP